MMKLLLAVIATCALVVSPTCIKIKHQLRSNAPTIHVLISNGNTQMTSQVGRNGSHRFITDNLSNMTLAPAGTQTITLSYDEIFPLTDAAVCTEVHPLSAGGCADGVCCKVSISMYTITDAIIMTARVNNRNADGNPQFWKCEQEIQVPGIANTEASLEELVTDILGNENPLDGSCGDGDGGCGTNAVCSSGTCECESGYVGVDGTNCHYGCTTDNECHDNAECHTETNGACFCEATYYGDGTVCADADSACTTGTANCHSYGQSWGACATGYATVGDGTTCIDIDECTTDVPTYKHQCHTQYATCDDTPAGSYNCTCDSEYYGDGFKTSEINPHTGVGGTGCTACVTCDSSTHYCGDQATSTGTSTCCKTDGCEAKGYVGDYCTGGNQCLSGKCRDNECGGSSG